MEFFFAVLFLLIYYIRPQDWVPGMAGFELVRPVVGLWLITLLIGKSRPSPLAGFARTPHDWIMMSYLGYIVFFGGGTIMGVIPLLAFYILTVHSVNSWPRMLRYLTFWNGALVTIALIGVLSTVGFDLTGAQENFYTQLGRLAIGTWLHDNPNALAHSVVVAIPGCFLLYFWKGSMAKRFVIFPAMAAIVFYCAWMTQSKGGYLVGAPLVVLTFVIGKPKWLQLTAISAALIIGVSALSFLPRMSDMNNLRADEGVQGRLLAWEMAKTAEENHHTGVGWRQFIAMIPWQEGNRFLIVPKGTHSSYVQVGADLGRYGLFLYLAGIWCALHTLLAFKSSDTTQERCRRILLVFVIANLISGWMINRQYHTEYFLLIAAAAAMHRLAKAEEQTTEASVSAEENSPNGRELPPKQVKRAWENRNTPAFQPRADRTIPVKPLWNRFGLLDLTICVGLTWLTLWTWDYVLKNI